MFEESEIEQKTLEMAQKIAHFSGQSIALGIEDKYSLGKRTFYRQAGLSSLSEAYKVAA